MSGGFVSYLLLLVVGIIAVISVVIGLDKMVKVVFGNYLIGTICLALNFMIDKWISYLSTAPDISFLFMNGESLSNFFLSGKVFIILVVYIGLLFLRFQKSTISIQVPTDIASNKLITMLFIPITIMSVILTLVVITLGTHLGDPAWIQNSFGIGHSFTNFLFNLPSWILVYTLIVMFMAMRIRFRKTYTQTYDDDDE